MKNSIFTNNKLFGIILIIIVSVVIILSSSIHIFAKSSNNATYHKYYTSIQIQPGDTLWSIADEYISSINIDKKDYISEICNLNNISEDNIHSGQYIIVAYYSQDEK